MPGPDEDGGEMECGVVGDGELVRPHCEAAPLPESGDAPLDGIALLVRLDVEAGPPASGATSPQAVAELVGELRETSRGAAGTGCPSRVLSWWDWRLSGHAAADPPGAEAGQGQGEGEVEPGLGPPGDPRHGHGPTFLRCRARCAVVAGAGT